MRLASWNVNSLRVRLPHLLQWLAQTGTDVIGIQETKLTDDRFPVAEISAAGYHVAFAGQPTYNGVAILARCDRFHAPRDVTVNNPTFPDTQVRIIAATLDRLVHAEAAARSPADPNPLRFISAYVPNGAAVGTDKYEYKLRWLQAFRSYLASQIGQHQALAVVGDFNIAPEDRDVHDPSAWHDQVLCSEPERQQFRELISLGLSDALRLCDSSSGVFSWWDYRQGAFRRNRGLRIDHLLLSSVLAQRCKASGVDLDPRRREQPSDHAPAWAELAPSTV